MSKIISNRKLPFDRPISFLDTETTGTEPATDRIVSLCIVKLIPGGKEYDLKTFSGKFNPGKVMPQEVIDIHGITNEEVKLYPGFATEANEIYYDFLKDCDLGGFCLIHFDIPIIWEELHRCGYEWDTSKVRILDVGNIYKKKEARTLESAVKKYCGREHTDSHGAEADVLATIDVFFGQCAVYEDIAQMGMDELYELSKLDDRIDLDGKIVRIDGVPCFNIGKVKGKPVVSDPSFARWMLEKDFSENTKLVLRNILHGQKSFKW